MAITPQIVRLGRPSEVRRFPYGRLELYQIGDYALGRAVYQPGWRWSQHVAPIAGTALCQVHHIGVVLSGRAAVRMADGGEWVLHPGDLFAIPAGHDSWVVGDEEYVSLHLSQAGAYAAPAASPGGADDADPERQR